MKIHAIAFTERGQAWEKRLGFPVDRGIPVKEWTENWFPQCDALLYIGACGIAVRAISGLIKSKLTDPAVLVMDEAGRHIIPLLSGHIGGANALAEEIGKLTGAEPVLTTATDVRGIPAVDTWAVGNDCAIENPEHIRDVSAALLDGKSVGVAVTERRLTPPYPVTLWLRPRTLVLGAGCRKGVDAESFERQALAFLEKCGVSLLSVRALATIGLKKEEPAFLYFCGKYCLELLTASAEELKAVPGIFAHSDFVEKTVGVGCVCERAAVWASGNGRLLNGKTAGDGITLALAGEENNL